MWARQKLWLSAGFNGVRSVSGERNGNAGEQTSARFEAGAGGSARGVQLELQRVVR
jgi:hypothetical protein